MELNATEGGATIREHYKSVLAKGPSARGYAAARQALQGPPFPDALYYLYRWATELHGRCGVSMAGVNPVSHAEIRAWAELTGTDPRPYEVAAIIEIDAVLRTPPQADRAGKA